MTHPLTKAFQELRKLGYIAQRKIACCRSCAWAKLEDEDINVVFTTDQSDKDPFNLYWNAENDDPKTIIKVLRANGLRVTKPKDPTQSIRVTLRK